MAVQYSLKPWEAAELFYRVAAKFQGNSLASIYTEREMKRAVEYYSNAKKAGEVSIEVFDLALPVRNQDEKNIVQKRTRNKNLSSFYNLCLAVKKGRPVVLDDLSLLKYVAYLKKESTEPSQIDTELFEIITPYIPPTPKHRRLERTEWMMLYYHEQNREPGVVKSWLRFGIFNRVELYFFHDNYTEKYSGSFELTDEYQSILSMKLYSQIKGEVNISVYLGFEIPYYCLGLCIHKGNGELNAKSIVFKKIEAGEELSSGFYLKTKATDLVPASTWTLLEYKNNIVIPASLKASSQY